MRMLVLRMLPIAAFVVFLGCGPDGPRKYEVSGTVKVDGKEVPDGDILFQSDDKSAGPDGGKIVAGKYKLMAREGKNKVEIRGTRTIPGKKGPMGEDWVEQFVPPEFNEKSTLTFDVKTSGNTNANFDLTTPKK